MAQPWTWRPSPGKGKGVFAMRSFNTGDLIMRDFESMRTPTETVRSDNLDSLNEAFDRLSPAEQAEYLQLHEIDQPYPSAVQRIFKANAFIGQDGHSFVYLDICKVNHSCIPNAEVIPHEDMSPQRARLVAIKPIAKDEEIFITYNTVLHMELRSDRREFLRENFNFECSCVICDADSHTVALSDARRKLLGIVFRVIKAAKKDGFAESESMRREAFMTVHPEAASKWQSQLAASPSRVLCSFSLLMARILQAEGIPCYEAGSAYVNAATHLASQMQARKDGIILLGAAENVEVWMKEGRRIIVGLCGAESIKGREVIEHAEDTEADAIELAIARDFEVQKSTIEAVARRTKDVDLLKQLNKTFALHFFVQDNGTADYEPITEVDCKRLVRLHRIDLAAKVESARAMDLYVEALQLCDIPLCEDRALQCRNKQQETQ